MDPFSPVYDPDDFEDSDDSNDDWRVDYDPDQYED